MELLLHNASTTDFNTELLKIITSSAAKEDVIITSEADAFAKALLKYRLAKPIVVIQVLTLAEISSLKAVKDLIDDLFLIIVTGNGNADLLQGCRQFYPRLLVSDEKDYELVDVVIRKQLNKHL